MNTRSDLVEPKLQELKACLSEIDDLQCAAALLGWDQSTYMPHGGATARGRQLATLGRLAHEKLADPALGRLLDGLQPYAERLGYESDEAALIRVTQREYERAVRIPASFVAEFANHQAVSFDAWSRARPADDFAAVRPMLEKTLDLSRRYADFFPGYDHIADPLIDISDHGMQAATVRELFARLREQLVPIVQAIAAQPPLDDACLRQHFPEDRQLAAGVAAISRFGYDFQRGRQDKTPHPFCTKFSIGDVRITTRIDENDLGNGFFSTLHESGHALYEQGIRADLEGTALAHGTSSGVHESQSRLWENMVGRSRGFWQFFYPHLQSLFPEQLGAVTIETFYRAVNRVSRSLIRTEADEVTYNLHVIMRFELELELLEGRLAVRDLPEVWRERYRANLGIAPTDDRDGVLQDVHWYAGTIGGAFQGYTLGNIMSAQFFEAATRAHPEIPSQIAEGQFDTLHAWLREHIYQHGSKYTAAEIVERATGGPLAIEPYIRYLRTKYGELYEV
jgi:carboxypeptidase Taq